MESDEQRTWSIGELADEVGVSTRTIRYYVSEGLLPPPIGSGPGSRYTEAHRAQLVTINALKEQYLPLKEIRRRLIGHGIPQSHASIAESHISTDESVMSERLYSRRPAEHRVGSSHPPKTTVLGLTDSDVDDDVTYQFRSSPLAAAPPDEQQTWRRIAISDEAELLITDNQYHRHRDKIDWLVQWAKRVLEP